LPFRRMVSGSAAAKMPIEIQSPHVAGIQLGFKLAHQGVILGAAHFILGHRHIQHTVR